MDLAMYQPAEWYHGYGGDEKVCLCCNSTRFFNWFENGSMVMFQCGLNVQMNADDKIEWIYLVVEHFVDMMAIPGCVSGVNEYGVKEVVMRCLEMSEILNDMDVLFWHHLDGLGPIQYFNAFSSTSTVEGNPS